MPDLPEGRKPCYHCGGVGHVQCDCALMNVVEGHPLNTTDWDTGMSRQGYKVMKCRTCGRIWGIRFQHDPGTGSDNRCKDYGFGDPFVLVTERHY